MRYFDYLSTEETEKLFYLAPEPFCNRSDKSLLAHAVGAALYMPATRPTIARDLSTGKYEGLTSTVIDLEDAVGDLKLEEAEESLVSQIRQLHDSASDGRLDAELLPLIFVRIRTPEQAERVLDRLGRAASLLTGLVFPKFEARTGELYLELLRRYNESRPEGRPVLYGMPILESAEVIYAETRQNTLLGIKELLDRYRDYVLNVRIGATDFSSLFGLRRKPDMTIYDIGVIRDCVASIVNLFGRAGDGYVISGPVWEYFKSDRVMKPQLRETPFQETAGREGLKVRMQYINKYVDGLIREVELDKENGIVGKTIIHPTHICPVQALYTVTHEEYVDAAHILGSSGGQIGVVKSGYDNKMNEIKPHLNWARRIMIRSEIYGVLNENQNYTALLVR
ncbi:HpcH/HpaI aldolase/citrate lyase family protein [Saccharibacillus sp. CPCC 101409]|uniref:HpcH/HpaI aldolase/citrate lyase family protein n=1 Tax=Saccharibacillus sp. CPCC 101409 TaxID=3058041 RepID=UPI002673C5D9|nr:HpcH/HpaI aldolase/citrate lyase family protein [Saccharibacillus sp. CPCC 101409]MDO3408523.1 HpcH/HpaI aldolase/citrate lyase family protein [Saccharibacillus sp. CPCC 101409]